MLMTVAGLAALVGYWLHAANSTAPLFSLALFRVPSYRIGILGNLFSRIGSSAMPMLIPLLLQVGLGLGPMNAGLMMVPVAAAGMVSKKLAVKLVERYGYRRVLMVNTVLVGLAMASFILMTPGQHLAWRLLQLAFFGAVNSLQFTVMNTVTLRDLDREFASSGNSLLSMVMMLAAGFGAAAGSLLAAFGNHLDSNSATRAACHVPVRGRDHADLDDDLLAAADTKPEPRQVEHVAE
jgi:predicted MFS family arabinose efflux permease